MNWETGIDLYTLICIKWITNKNLLYKKINKIKFQKKNLLKRKYEMFQTLHEISKNLIFVFVWKYVWKYVNINVSDIT